MRKCSLLVEDIDFMIEKFLLKTDCPHFPEDLSLLTEERG
jgi:hypothetical protein